MNPLLGDLLLQISLHLLVEPEAPHATLCACCGAQGADLSPEIPAREWILSFPHAADCEIGRMTEELR